MIILADTEQDVRFSPFVKQTVFIIDEESTEFNISKIKDTDLTQKVDRVLLGIANLSHANYTNIRRFEQEDRLLNEYESIFHFYLTNPVRFRKSEVWNTKWMRSKSGHWNYLVQ